MLLFRPPSFIKRMISTYWYLSWKFFLAENISSSAISKEVLLYPTILLWCKTSLAWLQLPSSYYILLLLVHAQLYIAVYIGQGFKKGLTFAQNSMTLVRVSSERCNWYYICNKHVWYEEKHLVAHAIPKCSFQWNEQYKIQAFSQYCWYTTHWL